MPKMKQPSSLKVNCLKNIAENMDNYWLQNTSEEILEAQKKPLYMLGPFECLDDECVDFILKIFYRNSCLNRMHLIFLLHNRLRKIDFSFLVKKKTILNATVSRHIGNNCFNLIELNLFAQIDLTPKILCSIFHSMIHLKKLDLSHTQANIEVCQLISNNCLKLEHVSFENCKNLYDDCIELITDKNYESLEYLNLDNVFMSENSVKSILLKCEKLKFFYASHLPKILQTLFNKINEEEDFINMKQFKLETFIFDSNCNLKPELMQSICFSCPNLKSLQISCVGSKLSISYLQNFPYLTELLLANIDCMISYRFDGYLMEALKNSIGKQLKSLHLIYILGTNLRSIAKYCKNLVKLNVEFLCYYEPAPDSDTNDSNNFLLNDKKKENEIQCINSLRHLSISNKNTKIENVHLNIGQFKKDLSLLLNNGLVKQLELNGLNEIDDAFFQILLSTQAPRVASWNLNNNKYILDNLEILKLKKMNLITGNLIKNGLLNNKVNSLKNLDLQDCKLITKADHLAIKNYLRYNKLDCDIKWS